MQGAGSFTCKTLTGGTIRLRDVQGLSRLAGMQRKRNPEQPDPQGKPLSPVLLGRCPKPQGIYTRMMMYFFS